MTRKGSFYNEFIRLSETAVGRQSNNDPYEEKGQSSHCLRLALFASVLEETGYEIGVKSSSLALHLSEIWPDGSDESLLLGSQQHG